MLFSRRTARCNACPKRSAFNCQFKMYYMYTCNSKHVYNTLHVTEYSPPQSHRTDPKVHPRQPLSLSNMAIRTWLPDVAMQTTAAERALETQPPIRRPLCDMAVPAARWVLYVYVVSAYRADRYGPLGSTGYRPQKQGHSQDFVRG